MGITISVSGLVTTFGTTAARDGLDLEVRTGEVHGFLGPKRLGDLPGVRGTSAEAGWSRPAKSIGQTS